jgi:hypothetical protein
MDRLTRNGHSKKQTNKLTKKTLSFSSAYMHVHGRTQVCNLDSSPILVDENVIRLNVCVNDVVAGQVSLNVRFEDYDTKLKK